MESYLLEATTTKAFLDIGKHDSGFDCMEILIQ